MIAAPEGGRAGYSHHFPDLQAISRDEFRFEQFERAIGGKENSSWVGYGKKMPVSKIGLLSKTIRFVDDFLQTHGQGYSFSERVSLLRARLSRRERTKILNFKVKRLGRDSFRIVLWEIFFRGEYKFESHEQAPLIFDCGANIGLATLYFKHLYPEARIVAFEADPETAAVLGENVSANSLRDVSVHNLMLTDGEGEYTFFSGGQGSLMGSATPGRTSGREIKVKGTRLSQFVNEAVSLLKLDVEGAEFDVLSDLVAAGKIELVERMIIEYHHKIDGAASRLAEFLSILERNGFEYQLSASGCEPISCEGVPQDVLIGAYRTCKR
jgi:FkbM family methyltransferase